MDWVVWPFDQRYAKPDVEVNVTDPPEQNVVGPPAEIVGVPGSGLTFTFLGALEALKHPAAFVT